MHTEKVKNVLNVSDAPEVLKCAVCACWEKSKGLAPFSILFCKQKNHADSRASPADIRKELEKYIGGLEPKILDSKIKVSVNMVVKKNKKNKRRRDTTWRSIGNSLSYLPLAPIF